MEKMSKKDLELLRAGIWSGSRELVVGMVDQETGVISEEIRIKPGDRIPPQAWKLMKDQFATGMGPIEVPYGAEGYTQDRVQKAIGKGRQ